MKYRARVLGTTVEVDIVPLPSPGEGAAAFNVSVGGRPRSTLEVRTAGRRLDLRFEGRNFRTRIAPVLPGAETAGAAVCGEFLPVELEAGGAGPQGATLARAAPRLRVASPMPGRVLAVRVAVGDRVERGDLLFTLEAMKMQNEFVAPGAGRVTAVRAAAGQLVSSGEALVEIEPPAGSS